MTLNEVLPIVVDPGQPETEVDRSGCTGQEQMEDDTPTTVIPGPPSEKMSEPTAEVQSDEESVLSFGDGPPRSPKESPETKKTNRNSDSSSDDEIRRPIVRLNRLDSDQDADGSSNDGTVIIKRPVRPPLDSDEESLMSLDKNFPTEYKRPILLNNSDSDKSKSSRSQKSAGQSESKQKTVKRMTKKQRDDVMKEIKSKTERMKREAPLKLPYHRPEVPSLNEFLERRNKAKAEFQTSMGPKFKLKGLGGLGKKLEGDLFKFDTTQTEMDTTTTPVPQNLLAEEAPRHPLQEIDKQIPFSSKVDEWMKNFENENKDNDGETSVPIATGENMEIEVYDLTENDVGTNTTEAVLIPTEGKEIELSTVKLEKIDLADSDSDDGLVIDEDNVELVDLADTPEVNEVVENPLPNVAPETSTVTKAIQEPQPAEGQDQSLVDVDQPMQGPSTNPNPRPNRFETLDAELNEYYEKMCEETQVKNGPSQRTTIADLLKSQPNHEELLKFKPKVGGTARSGFIDLDDKPKKPSIKQRKMQALMDRFVKHTAVQKKPKEQHFTVHVSKKVEDSQGQEKITVNEFDYVQVASDLVDDNEVTETGSPSPNRRQVVPGARFVKLRQCLRTQIQEKKKKDYVERMKRHAMDNEENYAEEGKAEEEEEEIIGDEDMTESESEPEVTDEEELENIRRKEKKNQKKKSAFVEDEAEDDEDEENKENDEGGDDDEDDETDDETGDDPEIEEEVEDDLISVKSSHTTGGKKIFQRLKKMDDSSEDDEEKDGVEPKAIVFDDDLGDFEAKETEDSIIKQFVDVVDKKSREIPVDNSEELKVDESQNSKLDMNGLYQKSSSDMFKSLDLDDNRNAQDMFAEDTPDAYNTDGFSPSLSNDDHWTTPKRPADMDSLFYSQINQTQSVPFKFSGQVDSQRPETPSPETWAMPKFRGGPGCRPALPGLNNSPRIFVSPTSVLPKVNSELALDYFLEDNTPSGLTPNAIPIPHEITKLFENTDGNKLPFANSPSAQNETEDDLLDLCSGKFPTQAPATPEESQSQDISEFDEDDVAMVSTVPANSAGATMTVTPVSSRRIHADNETPKISEKAMKTTRLFQEIEARDADVEDDEDDDKESVISGFKITKKRKRRLEFSDEEDEEDVDPEPEPEDDDEEVEPEYDENEEEIIKKPVFKGMVSTRTGMIRKEFVDAEAELSGSELGSGDEDERGLDYLDEEEGDAEKIDEDKLREEVGKVHFKQMLDEDQKQVRILQNTYLEHGDLHTDGKARERQFRWKNIDENMNNDDMEMDEEGKVVAIDEAEIQRQKERIEKVKWMKENSHLMESDDDEEEGTQNFLEDSQFLKIRKSTFAKIQSSYLHSDTSMSMPMTSASKLASRLASVANMDKTEGGDKSSQDGHKDHVDPNPKVKMPMAKSQLFFPSPEDPFSKIRKGSFLSRGSPTLSRLAEMTKINDSVSNVKSNSRNFVFAVVTPPDNKSNGNNAKSRKQANPARRSTVQPKKIQKIDRSFSSMDTSSKEASIFGWFK